MGHNVTGLPHPSVSNGFSGDMPLGMAAQSLVHSLGISAITGLSGLTSLGPTGLEGLSSAVSSGMIPNLVDVVSSSSTAMPTVTSSNAVPPHNPMMPSGLDAHQDLPSHLPETSLADLKAAGLDTSLGYYPSVSQTQGDPSMIRKQADIDIHPDVSALHRQHPTDPLVNYLASQEKKPPSSAPETPKSSSNSLNKPKPTPRNLSSWSSLAQSAVPSPTASTSLKTSASDSFAQFKRVAKEKEARQRQIIEQQEQRRRQNEQVEKERARQEAEKERARVEEEALERAMEQAKEARATQEMQRRESLTTVRERPPSGPKVATPLTASTSPHPQLATPAGPPSSHTPATPTPTHDSAKLSDRDRQKLREQERRRREAMAGQIDMNRQSDLMAAFEEQCGK